MVGRRPDMFPQGFMEERSPVSLYVSFCLFICPQVLRLDALSFYGSIKPSARSVFYSSTRFSVLGDFRLV